MNVIYSRNTELMLYVIKTNKISAANNMWKKKKISTTFLYPRINTCTRVLFGQSHHLLGKLYLSLINFSFSH